MLQYKSNVWFGLYFSIFQFEEFGLFVFKCFPKLIKGVCASNGRLQFFVKPSDFYKIALIIKLYFNFSIIVDEFAIDKLVTKGRFKVTFLVRRPPFFNFLTQFGVVSVTTVVNDLVKVYSLSSCFSACVWLEREIFDLFGIFFNYHPDLRRILTDYGFVGYPLRRDFPLTGYVEVRYDYSKQRIITEPVELTQEFRLFDFTNPWVSLIY